jgi:hypothetical protein
MSATEIDEGELGVFAHDRVEDKLNTAGRVFYGASTTICTPPSPVNLVLEAKR